MIACLFGRRLTAALLGGVWLVVSFSSGLVLAAPPENLSPEQEKFFEEKVRPVLATRCFACHGPKKQESGLRLDHREGVMQGGDGAGPAAIAGKPDESVLIAAVRRTGDYEMPPDENLPAEEIDALVKWVEMGLPWPASDGAPVVLSLDEQMQQVRSTHWSLQPIQRPAAPTVKNRDWPRDPLDEYILAKLEESGLAPSPEADRRTLIRRLAFDLTGLPPTPEQVETFLADESPDAYEQLVDRLLASPGYGERWGRHWLDVARYADTRGYAFARERRYPYSYTYRDYVIESLNADLPYNQFVREQLAGDLLPPEEGNRPLAALGFLTVGRKFNNRHADLDDQIDVVGRGLLGLTVACARCHDHKYDPIPTEDYYSLYGVFASSNEPEDLPLLGDPAQAAGYDAFMAELKKHQQKVEDYQNELFAQWQESARAHTADYLARVVAGPSESILDKLPFLKLGRDDLKPRLVERWRGFLKSRSAEDDPLFGAWNTLLQLPDEKFAELASESIAKLAAAPEGLEPGQINPLVKAAIQAEPLLAKTDVARVYGALFTEAHQQWKQAGGDEAAKEKLTPPARQLVEVLLGENSPTAIPRDAFREFANRAERDRLRNLEREVQTFQANSPNAPPRAMVVAESKNPHNPRVFIRGQEGRPGDPVPRQFLAVLEGEQRKPFAQGSGRFELAQKIASDENPLTARVVVNRLWMHHFGEPIVSTPSDFGVRTEKPLQADVLDYLAATLRDSGWSLKSLHRTIVCSSTYRQASSVANLAATDPAAKSPESVDPENRLLWRMNRKRLEFEPMRDALLMVAGGLDRAMGGRPVNMIDAPFTRRRSVYGFIDRQDLPNLLRVFDFASPDQSASDRPLTTVPQQALFLMNSPFVVEQAKGVLARPEVASAASETEKIAALYRVLFTRGPSDAERQVGLDFLQAATTAEAKLSPWEQYAQLLLLTNEFMHVD